MVVVFVMAVMNNQNQTHQCSSNLDIKPGGSLLKPGRSVLIYVSRGLLQVLKVNSWIVFVNKSDLFLTNPSIPSYAVLRL
jgi:hypothetical protein